MLYFVLEPRYWKLHPQHGGGADFYDVLNILTCYFFKEIKPWSFFFIIGEGGGVLSRNHKSPFQFS